MIEAMDLKEDEALCSSERMEHDSNLYWSCIQFLKNEIVSTAWHFGWCYSLKIPYFFRLYICFAISMSNPSCLRRIIYKVISFGFIMFYLIPSIDQACFIFRCKNPGRKEASAQSWRGTRQLVQGLSLNYCTVSNFACLNFQKML